MYITLENIERLCVCDRRLRHGGFWTASVLRRTATPSLQIFRHVRRVAIRTHVPVVCYSPPFEPRTTLRIRPCPVLSMASAGNCLDRSTASEDRITPGTKDRCGVSRTLHLSCLTFDTLIVYTFHSFCQAFLRCVDNYKQRIIITL